MNYDDGSIVKLGDVVTVAIPSGEAKARIVMLGDTYAYVDDINPRFLAWVTEDRILESTSVVVEWIDDNPFSHNDPRYSPVDPYMFSPIDRLVKRAKDTRSAP